jgi:hypothetical protein
MKEGIRQAAIVAAAIVFMATAAAKSPFVETTKNLKPDFGETEIAPPDTTKDSKEKQKSEAEKEKSSGKQKKVKDAETEHINRRVKEVWGVDLEKENSIDPAILEWMKRAVLWEA